MVIVLVVVFPVVALLGGGILAAALGSFLKTDSDAANRGDDGPQRVPGAGSEGSRDRLPPALRRARRASAAHPSGISSPLTREAAVAGRRPLGRRGLTGRWTREAVAVAARPIGRRGLTGRWARPEGIPGRSTPRRPPPRRRRRCR